MGICIKRITCLSMDKDNEKFYASKACVGDVVTLFFNNRPNVCGRLFSIKSDCIVLEDLHNNKKSTFYLKDIQCFNRDFRGSTSKAYFSYN